MDHAKQPSRWTQPSVAPWDKPSTALVIGGGIAGAATARALAARGIAVTVIEREARLGSGGSGNHRALVQPFLGSADSPIFRLHAAAFELARTYYGSAFEQCGAVQLPSSERLAGLLESLPDHLHPLAERIPSEGASEIAGVRIDSGAIHVARAGMVDPRAWLASLGSVAELRTGMEARALRHDPEERQWCITMASGEVLRADAIVVAAAHEASRFGETSWLRFEPVRGEVVHIRADEALEVKCAVCFDGYLFPARDGVQLLGASFSRGDFATASDPATQAGILERAAASIPGFTPPLSIEGRVCFRASTYDKLPFAGMVPDFGAMVEAWRTVPPGTSEARLPEVVYHPGLYLNAGHGSRGFTTAPLCAELLAAMVAGEASPLAEHAQLLAPTRFLRRIQRRREF